MNSLARLAERCVRDLNAKIAAVTDKSEDHEVGDLPELERIVAAVDELYGASKELRRSTEPTP